MKYVNVALMSVEQCANLEKTETIFLHYIHAEKKKVNHVSDFVIECAERSNPYAKCIPQEKKAAWLYVKTISACYSRSDSRDCFAHGAVVN